VSRVICVHNTTHYLAMHYMDLMRRLQVHHEVLVIAPHDGGVRELERAGVKCLTVKLSRRGMNPITDIGYLLSLLQHFRRIRPDIVFNFSIKPVIYGSIAAQLTRVEKVFSMVTGLGYVFSGKGIVPWLLRKVVTFEYRKALRTNPKVFFQNSDDRDIFLRRHLIVPDQGCIINGTGIDTDYFGFTQRPVEPFEFVLIGRMLKDKGIIEYCEAAKRLRDRFPDTVFRLVGPYDDNPIGLTAGELKALVERTGVTYSGAVEDVRPVLGRASVFVLPSYYREGTPRAILEAMASGLPVITTDHPGCRETLDPGVNGLLVVPRSVESLFQAMLSMRTDTDKVRQMGVEGRRIAESRYDVHKVNDSILRAMGEAT